MRRALLDHETPARRAWLEQLERAPGSFRVTRVGCDCMRLGWTQWLKGSVDGRAYGEALTPAGVDKLAQWRAGDADPFFAPFR